MVSIPIEAFIYTSVALVGIGLYGIFTRRSMIRILIGTEIIMLASMLNLVAFSIYNPTGDITGQLLTLFVIAIAAAETTIGLIIMILLYRRHGSIDISLATQVKGEEIAETSEVN